MSILNFVSKSINISLSNMYIHFILVCLLSFLVNGKELPTFMALHAPYTPFRNDSTYSLNLDVIPSLARNAAGFGVNTVFVGGGMGQFDTMTVSERNSLAKAWVDAKNQYKLDLYIIFNVGTTVQSEAIAMAKYGKSINVNAIASVPPYYEHASPTDLTGLFNFFNPIIAASSDLPFFYYHIPGSTGYNPNIYNFITEAIIDRKMPQLTGIKYVDSSDAMDWFESCTTYSFAESDNTTNVNDKIAMLYAPEPKLQCFANCMGKGTVLAEDFYAPTFWCMKEEYEKSNFKGAFFQEQWKYNMSKIFGKYPQGKRCVYQKFDYPVNIGPPRPPALPLEYYVPSGCETVIQELQSVGFFDTIKNQC